jgi:hypothetical protein
MIRIQPRQTVLATLTQTKTITKRAGGVAQGAGPEFKTQHWKERERQGETDPSPYHKRAQQELGKALKIMSTTVQF